jgi:hypothetical protein
MSNYDKKCLSDDAFARYRIDLIAEMVSLKECLPGLLRANSWDVALYKFYQLAKEIHADVRFHHRFVGVLLDSVDTYFRRVAAKAALADEASGLLMTDHWNNFGHALRSFNNCRPL